MMRRLQDVFPDTGAVEAALSRSPGEEKSPEGADQATDLSGAVGREDPFNSKTMVRRTKRLLLCLCLLMSGHIEF